MIYPIFDDSVFDRITDIQHALFCLTLLSDEDLLLIAAHHHLRVDRPPHLVREVRTREIVPADSCFAETTPVVDYDCRLVIL